MGFDPGKLKNRIRIEKRITGQNEETMKPEHKWVSFAKPWAEIMQPRGRWIIQAAAEHQETTVWFRIRYRKGIEPGMRVVFNDEEFKIEQTIPDLQDRTLLTLQCVGWDHADSN
ncbi:phage head closure protein [Bacillus velezensis]|uniref:phage head closure protein n=1 Tax=Bacillus amyloliquefaciens group TaxID=1938374 RepID=UPI00141A012F|nr:MULTISPECIES: phage head closure protein [Bacillus amyloliquefaciens group]MBI0440912.1 phage head closure protein [Bacillus velezensis]MEC3659234.1 phage head closure protein [Bacillus velezensis]MEC3685472.1 phage head closure protein [Bacillus velezensis]MEC3788422.1 phage head closure protein [Bacillus velezensis]MEC3849289.1 phage head closure protein [Bacillus velezensis]